MICPAQTPSYGRILIDIDTQSHFFRHQSSVCVRNARRTLGNIQKIVQWAQTQHVPTISTLQVQLSYTSCQPSSEPCHLSARKAGCTVCPKHLFLPAVDSMDWSTHTWEHYDQVILQKRCFDPFEELRIDRILTELPAEECILIGAPLEGAVKATALGLLLRGKNVTLVTNAIGKLDYVAGQKILDMLSAKGVRLVRTNALVGAKPSVSIVPLH